jgi:hypothetical protein
MRRYLRIAVSVVCLSASVLIFALWIRSYSRADRLDWPVGRLIPGRTLTTVSVRGLIMTGMQPEAYNIYANQSGKWRFRTGRIEITRMDLIDDGWLGFKFIRRPDEWGWQAPTWSLVAAFAVGAALPWIIGRARFSLRTLLLVVTLVAVLLGVPVML